MTIEDKLAPTADYYEAKRQWDEAWRRWDTVLAAYKQWPEQHPDSSATDPTRLRLEQEMLDALRARGQACDNMAKARKFETYRLFAAQIEQAKLLAAQEEQAEMRSGT